MINLDVDRRKFNMLTQNIVALNMKPEISMKDLEEMRGNLNFKS